MKKRAQVSRSGFTLVEILIAIVIVAILGAIALPRFFPQREKAVAAEGIAMLGALRQAELAYRLEVGNFLDIDDNTDADWGNLGITAPDDATAPFVYSVSGAGNLITATRSANNNPPTGVEDTTITLTLVEGNWGGNHPNRPN